MRAYLDRRGMYACRARKARDIFVIHTRPELVSAVQFFGTVKLVGTPSIPARFISHPHCKFPFPFPCLQRFPYPVELAASPSPRKRARAIVTEPESFARIDPTCTGWITFRQSSPPLLFSFACNPSHSSSWPRFVKVCVSTFIVRHDTEIYSYSLLPNRRTSSVPLALRNFRLLVSAFSLSLFLTALLFRVLQLFP